MANMYNIDDLTMTVQENPEWFTSAAFGGRLIEGGYIRALTGIKDGTLINQISLQNRVLQIDGRKCAWTPNQIIKLSDKKAKVLTYKINLEECLDDLEQRRTIHMFSPGAKNEELPSELEEATLYLIALALSNEIEELLIAGNADANADEFDGMVQTLLKSDESIQIPGGVFDAANILGLIAQGYDALPEDVLQSEDAGTLYAYISYNTRRLVRNALTTVSSQTILNTWEIDSADKKNPRIYYLGMELIPVKGMPDNTFVVGDSNNFFLLTDMMSDLEEIELGQYPKPKENIVWIKGRMRLGFMCPFPDEAVIVSDQITTMRGVSGPDLRVVPTNLVFEYDQTTAKTFTVITKAGVTVDINAAGSGFTATAGPTTDGVTVVTVTPSGDNTGNIYNRTGQVVVDVSEAGGPSRYATVMLEQGKGLATKPLTEEAPGGDPEGLNIVE